MKNADIYELRKIYGDDFMSSKKVDLKRLSNPEQFDILVKRSIELGKIKLLGYNADGSRNINITIKKEKPIMNFSTGRLSRNKKEYT